jgi:cell shape-determining protein MreC
MNKIELNDVTTVIEEVSSYIPKADIFNAFNKFMEYKRENEQTKREIARYEAIKEVMITEITKKYDFYEKLFNAVFGERKTAIDKYFEIIDKGIKENNNELVLAGLSNLSNVVASSPFANIGELKAIIESNKMIEM